VAAEGNHLQDPAAGVLVAPAMEQVQDSRCSWGLAAGIPRGSGAAAGRRVLLELGPGSLAAAPMQPGISFPILMLAVSVFTSF
jgi:hypothetical protein